MLSEGDLPIPKSSRFLVNLVYCDIGVGVGW